jgi:hypothetical protein
MSSTGRVLRSSASTMTAVVPGRMSPVTDSTKSSYHLCLQVSEPFVRVFDFGTELVAKIVNLCAHMILLICSTGEFRLGLATHRTKSGRVNARKSAQMVINNVAKWMCVAG